MLYFLDKYGYPVERIKGRYIINFIRLLLYTRKITRTRPKCLVNNLHFIECSFRPIGATEEAYIKYSRKDQLNDLLFRQIRLSSNKI